MYVKPEFSSSDLVLALAIVNGTAAAGARPHTETGDAGMAKAEGEDQTSRAGAVVRTTGQAR
jgi:hypothetical protein